MFRRKATVPKDYMLLERIKLAKHHAFLNEVNDTQELKHLKTLLYSNNLRPRP